MQFSGEKIGQIIGWRTNLGVDAPSPSGKSWIRHCFLPPASEGWGKVLFSQVSVRPQVGDGVPRPGPAQGKPPPPPPPSLCRACHGQDMAHAVHPLRFHAGLYCPITDNRLPITATNTARNPDKRHNICVKLQMGITVCFEWAQICWTRKASMHVFCDYSFFLFLFFFSVFAHGIISTFSFSYLYKREKATVPFRVRACYMNVLSWISSVKILKIHLWQLR